MTTWQSGQIPDTKFTILSGPATVTRSGVGVVPGPKGQMLFIKEQIAKKDLTYTRGAGSDA